MKKIIIVILISLAILSGCTNNEDERTLLIYSPYGGLEHGQYIKERAKEDLNIDIEFVSGGGATLTDKLLQEGKQTEADIVLSLYELQMERLEDEGLLKPYIPSWSEDIGENDQDNKDYYYSFGLNPIVMGYNSNYMSSETAPSEWDDLKKVDYKDTFVIESLGNQTTQTYLFAMLWPYYDKSSETFTEEGWNTLSQIYENSANSNEAIVWNSVEQGNLPIVLSWYGGIKNESEIYKIPIEYVEATSGTPIVKDSVALISDNPVAKEFIDWFGSPGFMNDFAEKTIQHGFIPLNKKVLSNISSETQKEANMFHDMGVDWDIIAGGYDEYINKIEMEIMK